MRHVRVTPAEWTFRGETGVHTRHGPLVIWGGIPGEASDVKILHEGQNRAYGSWQHAETPHPHRVEPKCGRYHLCGGCPLMHLTPEGQRDARRTLVRQALEAEELGQVPVSEVKPCPDGEEDFRWVIKLGVGYSDHGRLRVGAWGRRTRNIIPIPQCHVAAPVLRRVMGQVAHHVIEAELEPYNPETDDGVIRAIVLRGSRARNEVLVTFVVGRRVKRLHDVAEAVAAAGEVVGVVVHVNYEEGNAIYTRDEEGAVRTRTMGGRPYLEEVLGDVTYRIGPGDFFQTNPAMAEVLYADVLKELALEEGTPFVDLYCGVGGLALQAARTTGWALGVEGLEGAVSSAREAAARQKIPAEFHVGDVGEVATELAPRLAPTRPVVSVNPSRRGLEEGVVDAVLALKPRRLAYISCNPRALARDLMAFQKGGMRVQRVDLFDMFPQTAHVEAVAYLVPEQPDDGVSRRAPKRKVLPRKG